MPPRYNLRSGKPAATPAAPQPIPGEYNTPSIPNVDAPLDSSLSALTETESDHSLAEEGPKLLYSQVASSRTPSVHSEEAEPAHGVGSAPVTSSGSSTASDGQNIFSNSTSTEYMADISAVERQVRVEPDDDEGGKWTEVRRRHHSKSPDHEVLEEDSLMSSARLGSRATLSEDQRLAIDAAERGMSPADRERVQRRMQAVGEPAHTDHSSSRGEGPSRDKGKTVDPLNWGAVGIDPRELDPEEQCRALDEYSARKVRRTECLHSMSSNKSRDRVSEWCEAVDEQSTTGAHLDERPEELDRSTPTHISFEEADAMRQKIAALEAQVARLAILSPQRDAARPVVPQVTTNEAETSPISVKGRKKVKTHQVTSVVLPGPAEALIDNTLFHARRLPAELTPVVPRAAVLRPAAQIQPNSYLGQVFQNLASHDGAAPDPDPGDSPSSPNGSDSESGRLRSDSAGGLRDRQARKDDGKGEQQEVSKVPVLKPREPKASSGAVDVQAFHKFIQEATAYVDGYRIKPELQASSISYFLNGKAYEFYINTVSENPRTWTLCKMFIELFNYCFPVNFRQRMQEKLDAAHQGKRTVREFVYELKGLFLMVGYVPPEYKVRRLWFGLNGPIQAELWRARLTPETASWSEVQEVAEISELAHHASESALRRGQQTGSAHNTQPGSTNSGGHRSDERAGRKPFHGGGERTRDRPSGATTNTSGRPQQTKSSSSNAPINAAKPRLSDSERAELQAAGKCFLCREPGHMSRNCPTAGCIKSNQKGKAPGVSTFNVELDFAGAERLRDLAETTATIEEIDVNMMHFDFGHSPLLCRPEHSSCVSPDWSDVDSDISMSDLCQAEGTVSDSDQVMGVGDEMMAEQVPASSEHPPLPAQGQPYVPLGDLYAARATDILNQCRPFCVNSEPDDSFLVYRVSDDEHVIMYTALLEDVVIKSTLLQYPTFNLPAWYQDRIPVDRCVPRLDGNTGAAALMGDALALGAEGVLNEHVPYPPGNTASHHHSARFECFQHTGCVVIHDSYLALCFSCPNSVLENGKMNLPDWYATRVHQCLDENPLPFSSDDLEGELVILFGEPSAHLDDAVELCAVAHPQLSAPTVTLQRNSASPRDFRRVIPEPIVVVVRVNGEPARALLDSGSLSDFISAKLAHQLSVKTFELEKPLPVQLAVQGSRAKINFGCKTKLEYQSVREERYFDLINLLNYDLILGTPFLFQHQVAVGFNPTTVVVGSATTLPVEGKRMRVLESHAADLFEEQLEVARGVLREYAAPICLDASDSPLPPLRAINHTIPLKDPSKIYTWRPSKCPDAHRASWIEKRNAYLKSGRWRMSTARNASPMLLLTKPGTGVKGIPPRLRVVCDLRERNANTHKVTSPLPDMEGILRRLSRKPYRTLIDGKDAYEQIRIDPEHVERTAMTTPDGNMVSLVLQQGDCNAVATYQTLMNHIFGPYIGVFMDVYLDDIIIYSDSLADHIQHCKTVIDILKRETLYLSATKLKFLCLEMKVLGRIVDDGGIRMDPDKVDSVMNWKVPTNKELLRGFLGSVGYLADDIATIRIPMGILTTLTGSEMSFKWEYTHQRAFDEIRRLVHAHRAHHRQPLNYSPGAPRIWLVTDGSHGGIAGVVTQGADFREGHVAAFFSAKLSSAQMNYPVHEVEMLAGVESMLRHRDILLGCHFTWATDHKGLLHLLKQKNLSGRQARWLEKISEYDFEVEYVPGVENVLADALSRIYSNDGPGTVRAPSEYAAHDDSIASPATLEAHAITMPVLVGLEALATMPEGARRLRSRRVVPDASTGRPETAREFSKRIKRVILHGPRAERRAHSVIPPVTYRQPVTNTGCCHRPAGPGRNIGILYNYSSAECLC
ncbi:Retrovirus-related Pol polyprotein from transposon 17.6 [Grifola frondosa]|uniref:RNA-directed DNA polymerase n=1 Tax=Grifola frondosa TaxID=5627 RepID=A0A1C7LLJ0_GRIFR|nr:Retrovirus-related Pol polyprotein from transposon 17.6 [Grifola frondosa]